MFSRIPAALALTFTVCLLGCTNGVSNTPMGKPMAQPLAASSRVQNYCPPRARIVQAALIGAVQRKVQSSNAASSRKIADLVPEFKKTVREQELAEATCCLSEVVEEMAVKTPDFATFCGSYVEYAEAQNRCGEQTPQFQLQDGDGPPNSSWSLKGALQTCAKALLDATVRRPPPTREQLTLDEAVALNQAGQLGFHLTLAKNAPSIMSTGLDPRVGGFGGFCDRYRVGEARINKVDLEDAGYTRLIFKLTSLGHVHFTPEGPLLATMIRTYGKSLDQMVLIGIRNNGNIKAEPDPYYSGKALRTRQWIWSEDLVVIPRDRWKDFGVNGRP